MFRGGSIAVLRGNLCDSAVVKQAAATDKRLLQHTGRAVVFTKEMRKELGEWK